MSQPIVTPAAPIDVATDSDKAASQFSILNHLNRAANPVENASKAQTVQQAQPMEPFTLEQVKGHWIDYAKAVHKRGKNGLYTSMSAGNFALDGENTIVYSVSTNTMAKEIEDETIDLQLYMRRKLKNYGITLKTAVVEGLKTEKIIYTPRDKYDYLREKNPLMDMLRTELDLSIEF